MDSLIPYPFQLESSKTIDLWKHDWIADSLHAVGRRDASEGVLCNYCQQAGRWYDKAQSNLESEYKTGLYICGLWVHERLVHPEGTA